MKRLTLKAAEKQTGLSEKLIREAVMAGELNNQVKVGRESIDGWLVLLNEEELTHWACRVIKDKPAATKPSPAEARHGPKNHLEPGPKSTLAGARGAWEQC